VRREGQRVTLPALMHDAHTFRRLWVPRPTTARTVWMFGLKRRRVRRWECDTDMPNPGPLPQTSQTAATGDTPKMRWAATREDVAADFESDNRTRLSDAAPVTPTGPRRDGWLASSQQRLRTCLAGERSKGYERV